MELTQTDLHFVVSRLPKDIRNLAMSHQLIIAGGFIRETIAGGKVSDIDIFGPTEQILIAAANELTISRHGRKFATKNAITVLAPPRFPVQFITRWLFPSPEACTMSFDFTVCQAALWYDAGAQKWRSVVGEAFYADLAARRLVYTSPERIEEAGGSILRMRKFLTRGYSIQAESIGRLIARVVMGIDFTRVYEIADGKGDSREARVGKIIAGLLREVDPLTIIDGVEAVDEHQVSEDEP